MFVTDVFAEFHLEFEALGEVYPIYSLCPCLGISHLCENALKLILCVIDILIGRVEHKVVILGEYGQEGGLLSLN